MPRPVPVLLYDAVKTEINNLVEAGILVPVDFPTEWCSPIVCVPKENGKGVRICGDFTQLNKWVKRPVHLISSIDTSLARIKGGKYFSRLDVKTGYHQVKLSKESQKLTTIITPFGRFMYTRLAFGIYCSGDHFVWEFTNLLYGIPNVIINVDDVCVYAKSLKEHNKILRMVCKRINDAGITLNKAKCVRGSKRIEFAGHIISEAGIDVHLDRVLAIAEFPMPTSIDSIRQFVGVVNFSGKYIPNKSKILEPLNSLLTLAASQIYSGRRATRKF